MPDFTMKQSFPIASVIDAAQRKAQIEQQARQQGNESLVAGLQSIGQVGQSLYDQKKRVAQSLALGRVPEIGIPDELSRTLTPEQVIQIGTLKNKTSGVDPTVLFPALAALMGRTPPGNVAQPSASSPAMPASQAAPVNTPPQPNGAMLTSNVTSTPMPTAPEPLTPAATGQMSVPIAAPPAKKINKATSDLLIKLAMDNKPENYISDEKALKDGSAPHGTKIIHGGSSTDQTTWESASPQQQGLAKAMYEGRVRPSDIGFKERGKITMLANEYANHSGLAPFKSFNADVNATMAKFATSGKLGQNALSLNTALGHASSAYDSYKAMENTNQKWLNVPINKLKKETNDPNVVALGINLNALQGELANVFKNTGATDQEISHWREYLSAELTPTQFVGALTKIDELLRSRLDAMDYQRSQAGGGGGSLISPHGKQISQQLSKESLQGAGVGGLSPDEEQEYQLLLSRQKGGTNL